MTAATVSRRPLPGAERSRGFAGKAVRPGERFRGWTVFHEREAIIPIQAEKT